MNDMIKYGLRFFFGVVCIAGLSCSNRERTNPLDPMNPNTQGHIQRVRLLSEKDTVTIEWDAFALQGITGYRVYRRSPGASEYAHVALIPHPSSQFYDGGQVYDQSVGYQVSVQIDAYESPPSDTASITPGPYCWWVADYYGGVVAKLTYDGLHMISKFMEGIFPVGVASDSVSNDAWVIDASGFLVKFSSSGTNVEWMSDLEDPTHIDFNSSRTMIWIADSSGTQVVRMDTSGNVLGRITGFDHISGLSTAGRHGGCWISDADQGRITLLSHEGLEQIVLEEVFESPGALSYDDKDEFIWAVDSLKLFRITLGGIVEEVFISGNPIRHVSAVQGGESCWIIIDGGDVAGEEVLKVNMQGDILVRSEGYQYALSVEANSHNGGCLIAETGIGAIVILSGEGERLGRLQAFAGPTDLALE